MAKNNNKNKSAKEISKIDDFEDIEKDIEEKKEEVIKTKIKKANKAMRKGEYTEITKTNLKSSK